MYVIAKGKDHKQYEYGNKVSIVSTKDNNIIVGVVSHDKNIHDSKTLDAPSLTLTVIALSPFSKQYVIEVMLVLKRF
ncbi:ISPg7, transposase [uncultured Gammaproteobacteria bacterium]|nr:ISPg7, transposase [uncultured Gammaproteobacteria bacterium]